MSAREFLPFARTVSACTFLSRLLGLVRLGVSAWAFGAGDVMDAFVLAFRIPNLFRRMFGEGALSLAFVPVVADYTENRREAETRDLVNVVFTAVGGVLSLLVALGIAGTWVYYRRADPSSKAALLLRLLWITLPYAIFICLTGVAAAVLNTRRHFLMPALAPAVLNVFWIGGVLALWPLALSRPVWIYGPAVAILAGGMVQLGMQLPVLQRKRLLPRFKLNFRHPGLRRTVKLMVPMLVGAAAIQVNILLDSVIAWVFVGTGGVSNLFYGDRLVQFPLGVFGMAVTTAAFPAFARTAADGDLEGLTYSVGQALRAVAFVALPAALGLILIRAELADLLFRRGGFGAEAVSRTSRVVLFYSLGLWAYCSVHVLTRAFYSLGEMRTPVKLSLQMIACNLALNLTLVWPLKEAGLALATALTATLSFPLLFFKLRRRLPALRGMELLAAAGRAAVACAVMAVAVLGSLELFEGGESLVVRALRVLVPVAAGAAAFGVVALATRNREMREILSKAD